MLQKATISFLDGLAANNNKPWFDANRTLYDAAKQDFEAFVTALHKQIAALEPDVANQKPKDSIFRIFRDVRFAKDKAPYKPNFGAYFSRAGRKAPDAGYYIHIQPGEKSFVAGGLWMPEGPLLKKTRQEIDYNFNEFLGIINNPAFKKHYKKLDGEKLKTLPQGYTADNPAIDYLKFKSFIVSKPLADKDLASKTLDTKVMDLFAEMKPFVDFLNKAID